MSQQEPLEVKGLRKQINRGKNSLAKQFHLVRKSRMKLWQSALYILIGVVVALAIGAAILTSLDISAIDYYSDMFTIGLVGNAYPERAIENFLVSYVPLLITSLALALSFKMRFWNIGGEGQFLIGALTSAVIAIKFPGLNPYLMLLLMSVVAMLCSGVTGLAIARLKTKYNTNETLATLMINYIALYVVTFFGETKADWNFFLRTDSERPKFTSFTKMPFVEIGDFHLQISVLVTLLIATGIWFYLRYTKQGYEISVIGDSRRTATYAGMNVKHITLRTMFTSAALIGLAGAFTASSSGCISTNITNNVGWTGIIVAWLSKLSIPGIVLSSFLITILQFGCRSASSLYPSIDSHFADLLQGLILFAVLAADFFANYKVVRIMSAGEKQEEQHEDKKEVES